MSDDNNTTQSIEDLISFSEGGAGEDESAQQKFFEKQGEIKKKEIERITKQNAASQGLPYIDLAGFAISPDALVLVDEAKAVR
ncbi:hypothetical protein KAU19_06115, partial [Candidatus Parcubacteria bacterium]|nr:hypothetical protein [Candidatus Parcubacteria bacterium]